MKMNVPGNLKDLGSCWDSRRLRSFDNLFGELNRLSEESSLRVSKSDSRFAILASFENRGLS